MPLTPKWKTPHERLFQLGHWPLAHQYQDYPTVASSFNLKNTGVWLHKYQTIIKESLLRLISLVWCSKQISAFLAIYIVNPKQYMLWIDKNFNTTLTQSQNFLCEVKLCCRNWTDTRQQPDNDEKCFGNTQNNINTPLKNANTALFFNFD